MTQRTFPPAIGDELDGRYRILDHLGSGGMGEVFLAQHIALHRTEALKILKSSLASTQESVTRFRREARATNRLQHPNIVRVYDFGQLPDGRFYLSTEYVDGENLASLLANNGPMPAGRAVRILAQLADAMAHAHERGVVHRDLKPGNLMLISKRKRSDVLKVLDFGIAKIIAPDYEDSVASSSDMFYGTPEYVAPERLQGAAINPSVDIYAVGCIGYEMLTGAAPFEGRPMEVLHHHMSTEPAPPSSRCSPGSVSEMLDAVLLHCLEKKPVDRYQSAANLAATLRQLPCYKETGPVSTPLPRLPKGKQQKGLEHAPTQELDAPDTELLTLDTISETEATETGWDSTQPNWHDSTDIPTNPPWMSAPKTDQYRENYHAALRALAEALIDNGCNDVPLIIAVAAVASADDDLAAQVSQLDDIERRISEAEETAKKRESSLRFALAELRFERDRAAKAGEAQNPELQEQIKGLESRLTHLSADLRSSISMLTEEAIRIAALRADLETQLVQSYKPLLSAVERQLPRFVRTPAIAQRSSEFHAAERRFLGSSSS